MVVTAEFGVKPAAGRCN